MINSITAQLSSIKVKLFLWFWLVTICSIAATRFVSTQLNDEYLTVKPHHKDLRRISYFIKRVEQLQPNDLQAFVNSLKDNRRLKIRAKQIVIKPLNNEPIIADLGRHAPDILRFLQDYEFKEQQSWLFYLVRLTGPQKLHLHGKEYLVFYQSRAERPKDFRIMLQELPIWIRFGTPLLVSIIFCWLLARSLSRPLSNIANVAQKLGQGNLSVRVEKDAARNDELGNLAKSFNQMAEQLENNVSAHQRLIGDVSHELRSPLTRLQMALALAEQNKSDATALTNYINRCSLEVGRLDSMIEHVLTLSRLENSSQQLDKQTCSLASLVSPLIDDGNFLGQDKNVEVTLVANCEPDVMVDQALIASAISNIINNAVKYSPENGLVTVSLSESKTDWLINISDQGRGVPEHLLPKLFEPFYRIADARDRASGGTGLGLAIAKQAVLAHHGTISAQNQISGGLTVSITLPK